jgi:hypothetical protein
LDEYFTILFNLEALPSFSWVLNFFTFLHSVVTASHDSLSSAGGCCGALSTLWRKVKKFRTQLKLGRASRLKSMVKYSSKITVNSSCQVNPWITSKT